MRSILSVLVENEAGALARISGLFSRRGYNIDSLTVGPSETPELSRMIIVTDIDNVEQIQKQLHKLINVIKITNLSALSFVDSELAMIKVSTKQNRSEIAQIADLFKARIIDVSEDSVIIEVTGDVEKISALVQLISPFGIKELARTGAVAMARGTQITKPSN